MGLFNDVTRERSKLRLALTGVTGAGKTLGALYVAYGITGDWSKIALIDTEHGRGKFYANRSDLNTGTFKYAEMNPPYSPDKYKQYVAEAASVVGDEGIVIVDSFSHAWNNEGGVLEIKDKIAATSGKNSYTAWAEAGKEQNSLVNSVLSVNCHTIITMRSKMDYIMVENDRGKQQPMKVGLAPIQRDDTEYEFDIVLDIARSHIATAVKDTTFLDKFNSIITPELGHQLKAWLDEGEEPAAPICEVCGNEVKPNKDKTAKAVAEFAKKYTGKVMCKECYIAWHNEEARKQKEKQKQAEAANAGSERIPA